MNNQTRKIERLKAEMEVVLWEFFAKDLKKLDMVMYCDGYYQGFGEKAVKGFIGFANFGTKEKFSHDKIKATLSHDLNAVQDWYRWGKDCMTLPKSTSYTKYYNK